METRVRETNLERLMTLQQVADFLHVSKSSVRRWSCRGALRSYVIGGRGDRRYRVEDVLAFLEGSSRPSSQGASRKGDRAAAL